MATWDLTSTGSTAFGASGLIGGTPFSRATTCSFSHEDHGRCQCEQMTPYEALYRQKYKSLIGRFDIGETKLVGPDFVQQDVEKKKKTTTTITPPPSRLKTTIARQRKNRPATTLPPPATTITPASSPSHDHHQQPTIPHEPEATSSTKQSVDHPILQSASSSSTKTAIAAAPSPSSSSTQTTLIVAIDSLRSSLHPSTGRAQPHYRATRSSPSSFFQSTTNQPASRPPEPRRAAAVAAAVASRSSPSNTITPAPRSLTNQPSCRCFFTVVAQSV
uniref:Flocculation protein FLO11-like n=1 Tax=Nicotiana sylvestris TaxID=4096 RepID=A0A1U7WRG8_NICSY|nr:PREDICTED: flocculation protein FLO11-like [Nicotiana sylvestris]